MSGLNEQIAVLDGLSALDPNDGRIGQQRARVDQYGRAIAPGVLARNGVLDASAGANFSGGSSYAAGLPLLPSNAGLAGEYGRAGLGAHDYGRAGLGAGEYGRAGLGRLAGSLADADLMSKAETVSMQQQLDPSDGRIGQFRAQPTQYANRIAPGVLQRRNVIDASAGANYSGGSSYAPGLPLMPSSIGLAGLDAAPDAKLGIVGALKKQIGQNVVVKLKKQILGVERLWKQASPAQKEQLFAQYRNSVNQLLAHLQGVRQMRMKALALRSQGVRLPKAA